MNDLTDEEIVSILESPSGTHSHDVVFMAKKLQEEHTFEKCQAALENSPAIKLAITHVNRANRKSLPASYEWSKADSTNAATLAQDMMYILHEIHTTQQEAIDNPEKAIVAIIKKW